MEGISRPLGGWFLESFLNLYQSNLGKYKDRKANTYYSLVEFREHYPLESFDEIYDYIREHYKNNPGDYDENYEGMREFIRKETVSKQSAAAAAAAAAQEQKRNEKMIEINEYEPAAAVEEAEEILNEGVEMNDNYIELPGQTITSIPEYNLLWEDSESITYEDENGEIHTEPKAKSGAGWLLAGAALLFLL